MKTILIYGDSNTWGFIPGSGGKRFALFERWAGVLGRDLGDQYHIIEEGLCGRTTTSDDLIEGEGRNGIKLVRPVIQSHLPLDYCLIMLGTNDLKNRFCKSSLDIALGIFAIANTIKSEINLQLLKNHNNEEPLIIVMVPPPIKEVGPFRETFFEGKSKSEMLIDSVNYVAYKNNFRVFDTSSIVSSSDIDGIHLSKSSHFKLGKAIAEYIRHIEKQKKL